jgi:dTDP-glucose 4,6-dehydratase
MKKTILITGGAGFIGSHLVKHFVRKYPAYKIINLDNLTYAGNLSNLTDIQEENNYLFVKGNICDDTLIKQLFLDHQITDVLHCAAESHVDRSITNPLAFVETNVIGTVKLLHTCRNSWNKGDSNVFYHISTDEVYGSLGAEGQFTERTAYDPRSPYSASKASSDHFVRAYYHTYGLPIKISNCSNNYGPYQFPEKLIPLMINNMLHSKPLPVYGKGENVRDWLYVQDHVVAIDLLFHEGKIGETYNIGGDQELQNIELVRLLCDITDSVLEQDPGTSQRLIHFVKDRPGHDLRYAVDFSKINSELNWYPKENIQEGLEKTVDWYLSNKKWLEEVVSGEYQNYYNKQYLD